MNTFFARLRSVAVSGFLFLMPLYVVVVITTRAWTSLSSLGAKIAAVFGLKSVLGVGGSTVLSGLLLIAIWLACGVLVHISFVAAFRNALEGWSTRYIPGYATYKEMAEERVAGKTRNLPYTSALIRQHEFWRPAYVVEQHNDEDYVVFLPGVPDTNTGTVLLAKRDELRLLPSMTANQLDASLKKMGKGLLSEYGIHRG